MRLRCRQCGKDNFVDDEAEMMTCEFCGTTYRDLDDLKVVERKAAEIADPLAKWR
jgi:hypothetical protein